MNEEKAPNKKSIPKSRQPHFMVDDDVIARNDMAKRRDKILAKARATKVKCQDCKECDWRK